MSNYPIIISVSGPKMSSQIKINLNWDASIDDWINAFKTILIHQTFDEETVKEIFEPYLNPDQWMLVEEKQEEENSNI